LVDRYNAGHEKVHVSLSRFLKNHSCRIQCCCCYIEI